VVFVRVTLSNSTVTPLATVAYDVYQIAVVASKRRYLIVFSMGFLIIITLVFVGFGYEQTLSGHCAGGRRSKY